MASHTFHAVAFVENLSLKELAPSFPEAKRTPHELWYSTPSGGTVFVYPFGAVVFHNAPPAERERQMGRLHASRPGLTNALGYEESFTVREEAGARTDVREGELVVDKLSFEGTSVVAMTVALVRPGRARARRASSASRSAGGTSRNTIAPNG